MATNYLIGEDGASLPEGIALAHTLYGEPDRSVTHAYTATGAAGVELVPAPFDGIEYIDPETAPPNPRAKRCRAKDDTCMGWRINGSELCAAHAGLMYDRWAAAREAEAEAEAPEA